MPIAMPLASGLRPGGTATSRVSHSSSFMVSSHRGEAQGKPEVGQPLTADFPAFAKSRHIPAVVAADQARTSSQSSPVTEGIRLRYLLFGGPASKKGFHCYGSGCITFSASAGDLR
jgi:hypothetical protein